MAFDQATRNRLARFVSEARSLLTEEFTRQLQHEYGLDPASGTVTPLEKLTALDDTRWETASILRETMAYYLEGKTGTARERKTVLDRILREQAFTVLNRICALRLAEARGLILQAVGGGYQSQGFQLYARLAGPALGETGEAYRSYLFSLFDEMAVELPPLFDRFSPEGRLFPRQTTLLSLLDLLNDPELETLWGEDETIGWIYQYFNTQEERRAMRAASQAPRNSRELAVRNQFFTPRYVVEFLTDNTLGRIWYEMTKGQTALVDTCTYLVRRPTEIFLDEGVEAPEQESSDEELSQEELLCQPVYIQYRQLKDPREIKMLDPACGSMHFGLYAFDLFEQIYAEAWELEESLGAEALWRLADLEPLHETYPDKAAFLRDVPRLIIEYNIHGIDIDARAVQIAGLSLWLRAHKNWGNSGVRQADRPQIRKSNIVCAEPMPGDRGMLDDFLTTLDEARLEALLRDTVSIPAGRSLQVTKAMADALVDLVPKVWEEMELAGEAGSLLKVEETLRDAIAAAREVSAEKSPLFRVLEYDLGGDFAGKVLDFWDYAERLVIEALQEYAERSANGVGYRKRLFAGDAAQGFSFIQVCRQSYDVVLMNPPFGEFVRKIKAYAREKYPSSYNDIFAAFTDRFLETLSTQGLLGAITSRNGFFLGSFNNWRKDLLMQRAGLHVMADLGENVMDDAMVEAAAYCFQKSWQQEHEYSIFVRLLGAKNREKELRSDVNNLFDGEISDRIFIRKISDFGLLRQYPFAYWVNKRIVKSIARAGSLEPDVADVRCGLSTGNNERFVRALWEIPSSAIGTRWIPLVMTGTSQPWFSPLLVTVDWKNNGGYLASYSGSTLRSTEYYFRSGISWTRRAVRFMPYAIPAGCIPSASRYMAFPNEGNEFNVLGYLSSNVVGAYTRFFGEKFRFPNFLVDTVKSVPWPDLKDDITVSLVEFVKININERRKAYQSYEPFQEFLLPRIIQDKLDFPVYNLAFNYNHLLIDELEKKIAHQFGFDENDTQELERDMLEAISVRNQGVIDSDDNADESDPLGEITIPDEQHNLISYIVGTSFGRWDIRYAIGERTPHELPDPFATLSPSPPGMLQNAQGLPAVTDDMSPDYPLQISWLGILADHPGHHEDIVHRAREALQVIWGERGETIETEACEILGISSLREYFQRTNLFFDDHLKRYSKSRRYAPIYWPLSTPSGSYSLWLYYHRINDQILFACVNDFVDPKIKQVGEDLVRLRSKSGRSRDEESELERLSDLERELKDFRAELLRVAAFWKPNLNDGVQITAAPLWRLFQHRNWQKRLKSTWEKLEAGEYDWAHLAYSIWPERVREKCKTDKSLAIAHDLEHLYVEPVKKTKKTRRKKSGQAKMDL